MPSKVKVHRTGDDDPPFKLTLCVDFHGVIHSHTSKNHAPSIGPGIADEAPVPGAFEWLERASEFFRVVIVCARFSIPGPQGMENMIAAQEWFRRNRFRLAVGLDLACTTPVILAPYKPTCHVLLDDRAITFDGSFPDPKRLFNFRPWNR